MEESQQLKLVWDLFVELRKEILETQKIRAQIIGFKITFLGAAVGLILAHKPTIDLSLLFIPALASVLFDFPINSFGVSINRIGYYIQMHLEPQLRDLSGWNREHPMWEEFTARPSSYPRLFNHFFGNLGLTALVMASAGFAMSVTLPRLLWIAGCALLGAILISQTLVYVLSLGQYQRRISFLSRSGSS